MTIKLGSLFDGIGVFPLAAARCGITPVWASEIEKAPISITKRHFPDMAHLGDITRMDGGAIPPVHVLTFGSPCQNLSQIGNRDGLAGAKSSLFFQAIRIIKEMRDATDNLFPVKVRKPPHLTCKYQYVLNVHVLDVVTPSAETAVTVTVYKSFGCAATVGV